MKLNEEKGKEPFIPERVARSIIRVPMKTRTIPPATRTNCYLIHDGGGWLVVDFGSPDGSAFSMLDEAVEEFCKGWKNIHGLLLTHHHDDHTGGLANWLSRFKEPILAHPKTIAQLGRRLPASRAFPLADLDRLGNLEVFHTPGHASGHIVVSSGEGDLLCGDLIAGLGTIVIDPPDGSMGDYLASLARIEARNFDRGLPGHGPAAPGLSLRIRSYRQHRMARDEKVLAALASFAAPATLIEVTERAYDDVAPALHPVASRSALAHLLWAVERGLATRDDDGRYRAV